MHKTDPRRAGERIAQAPDLAGARWGARRKRQKLSPIAPPVAAPAPKLAVPCAWYVVKAVPRSEHNVKQNLENAGHEVYLPILRKDIFNKRTRVVEEREFILFAGYMFARLPLDHARSACEGISGIEAVLGSTENAVPIVDAEVERFREAQANLDFDETRAAMKKRKEVGRRRRETLRMKFRPRMRIRATKGPFVGFHGEVVNVNGRGMIEAMMQIFARATPVEFPAEMIETDDEAT
jgi:transcription antitermination factor NusG